MNADLPEFLSRWRGSGASEDANRQMFLAELCDVLGVPRPHPATDDDTSDDYRFERVVHFNNPDGSTSIGKIDLYRRGCFVLEAKQGADAADPAAIATLQSKERRTKQPWARPANLTREVCGVNTPAIAKSKSLSCA